MEEITLICGDSSDIFEFSSKQVDTLTNLWEGSWVISETLGGNPILEGPITKNEDILNNDSLVDQDFRTTYKIFETTELEKVIFNQNVIVGNTCTISGKMYLDGVDANNDPIEVPEVDRYITVTIKGIFVSYSREMRVQTDINGEFSIDFNIGATIKTPLNSFFIFQIMPLHSEQLLNKTYYLTVEVRQKDIGDIVVFRKELLQTKLKITKQGVI